MMEMTRPTSFEEWDAITNEKTLVDVFETIAGNILADATMLPLQKAKAIQQAATDLADRLAESLPKGVGRPASKEHTRERWVTPYIDMLILRPGAKDAKVAEAVKELRSDGHPAGQYVADLLERGAVKGG